MKNISKIAAALAITVTLALTAIAPASAGIIGNDRYNSSTSLGSTFDADLYAVAYSFSPRVASFLVRSGLLR
jgi:hypothetical protein